MTGDKINIDLNEERRMLIRNKKITEERNQKLSKNGRKVKM